MAGVFQKNAMLPLSTVPGDPGSHLVLVLDLVAVGLKPPFGNATDLSKDNVINSHFTSNYVLETTIE